MDKNVNGNMQTGFAKRFHRGIVYIEVVGSLKKYCLACALKRQLASLRLMPVSYLALNPKP